MCHHKAVIFERNESFFQLKDEYQLNYAGSIIHVMFCRNSTVVLQMHPNLVPRVCDNDNRNLPNIYYGELLKNLFPKTTVQIIFKFYAGHLGNGETKVCLYD